MRRVAGERVPGSLPCQIAHGRTAGWQDGKMGCDCAVSSGRLRPRCVVWDMVMGGRACQNVWALD